jgi:hypothetical protein
MQENSRSTKKYQYFVESIMLPNGKWLNYHCFRSTVGLDAAMFLFKQKSIRMAVTQDESVRFEQSYFRTKNVKIYPGVQVGAAFATKEEFAKFETAWNKGMAMAEIRRIEDARINSGGSFIAKHIDTHDRCRFVTARLLAQELFEGVVARSQMEKLIDNTESLVDVRKKEYDKTPEDWTI